MKPVKDGFYVSFNDSIEYLVVVYSPGYGSAVSWNIDDNGYPINVNKELAELVFKKANKEAIEEWFKKNDYQYPGKLKYELVQRDKYFIINEYDGDESVITENAMLKA